MSKIISSAVSTTHIACVPFATGIAAITIQAVCVLIVVGIVAIIGQVASVRSAVGTGESTGQAAYVLRVVSMAKLKISFRKLDELAYQSFHNGIRLHSDSIVLLEKKCFASSFALSVLASEELGKGFAIEEIIFQARLGEGLGEHDGITLRALLSDHKLKQGWFASSVFDPLEKRGLSRLRRYQRIQTEKNNALYVGVRPGNHQIVRPFRLSRSKARRQVLSVNNGLLSLVEIKLDNPPDWVLSDDVLRSRRLLKSLKSVAATLN